MNFRSISASLACLLAAGTLCAQSGPHEAAIRRNVGVGLGTTIWGNVGDGLLCQILAATTNGSCGNQTFAVSSGTLGANQPSHIVRNELTDYLKDNMDTTARAIARGRGESLDAVMDILAVPAERRTQVASALQAHFTEIYPVADTTHDQVAERIMATVKAA
nr:DUF3015 family protein [uncultured Holophaga sp.]